MNIKKITLLMIMTFILSIKLCPKGNSGHGSPVHSGSRPKTTEPYHNQFQNREIFLGMKSEIESPEELLKHLFDAILKKEYHRIRELLKLGAKPNAIYPNSTISAIEFANMLDDKKAINMLQSFLRD